MFNDVKIETSAIATAIYNREALELLAECDDNIFYNLKLKKIFGVIKYLFEKGYPVDLITIRQRLKEIGELENIGGDAAIASFAQTYTTTDINFIIRKLVKFQQRRELQNLSYLIDENIKTPGIEVEEIFNNINETVRKLDNINNAEYIEIKELLKNPIESYDVTGKYIQTGFEALDSKLIGLFKSELSILAARPGNGKTALALNIAANVSKMKNVLFISLEMTADQLGLRLISAESMVNSDFIRRGRLQEEDYLKIKNSAERLKLLNLSFVEAYTLDEIIALIRKRARTIDIGLVIIDYLQLIQVNSKLQRYIQIGEISRRLKLLTRELDLPILCLAQLARSAEDRVPKLSDLRESGDIEQDADVVMFIHKDPSLKKGKVINIFFAKNRSGQADSAAEMLFDKTITRFFDVDYSHENSRNFPEE